MSQGLIQGSMREAPLPDIIQLVSQGGKSGCFHISEDPKRAKIFLKDGRISHAVTNDAQGLDAVYEVALWLDGHYHFEEGEQDAPVTITKSNATVLMEMHRRMDEWRVINQKISSLDLYPNSTLLPGDTPHGVNPREAKLLSLLTGFYTVAELAEVFRKPVLTIAKDLYGLVMAGHVVLKGIRTGKPPELPPELAPQAAPQAVPIAPPSEASPSFAISAPDFPPPPEPAPVSAPRPGMVMDPSRMAKLGAFNQRIVQAAKFVLPGQYHEMVNQLYAKATQQIMLGEGPETVKNLALAISRGAVDAGCDSETVKLLNANIKALFSK